jgi:hypothetical protein
MRIFEFPGTPLFGTQPPNCGRPERKLDCIRFYETRDPRTSPLLDVSLCSTVVVLREPLSDAPDPSAESGQSVYVSMKVCAHSRLSGCFWLHLGALWLVLGRFHLAGLFRAVAIAKATRIEQRWATRILTSAS